MESEEEGDKKKDDIYVLSSPTSTFYHQLRSVLIKFFKSLMVEKTYTCLFNCKRRRRAKRGAAVVPDAKRVLW